MNPSKSDDATVGSGEPERGSFVREVLPALVWTVIVFTFGGIPNPAPPVELDFPIDKVEHAVAFAILQVLAYRALRYELPQALPRAMPWIAALVSTAVGGALELYQLTVPNRSAEFMDLAWDAIGALAATIVTLMLRARR